MAPGAHEQQGEPRIAMQWRPMPPKTSTENQPAGTKPEEVLPSPTQCVYYPFSVWPCVGEVVASRVSVLVDEG
jgi:hypothetical protein